MNSFKTNNLSVYTCEQIRHIERLAKSRSPTPSLMQRAGLAAANFASQLAPTGSSLLVFAGAGDNGGDAFELAAHLSRGGYRVSIYMLGEETNYSPDALLALRNARSSAITWIGDREYLEHSLNEAALIIDGLFGIGLNRPITGLAREIVGLINHTSSRNAVPVLAIDIPSGLMADTGQTCRGTIQDNKEMTAVRATHTITFIAYKPGLFTAKGRDLAGQVLLDTLDIDPTDFPTPTITLNTGANTQLLLTERLHDSNKGSFGNVTIIGGAGGMYGAPILGARAALFAGAGKVHIGFCSEDGKSPVLFDPVHPEIMCHDAGQTEMHLDVVAIGPGLGKSKQVREVLATTLTHSPRLVIDADAINLIAEDEHLQELLVLRSAQNFTSILTPHPLEAARLLQTSTTEVQADRLSAAAQLTKRFQAIFILKGSGSIICSEEQTYINTSGNPALATGGTGDVLTGVCAALLTQGLTAIDAARLACFVHGAAADDLVAHGIGPIGLVASELPAAIRQKLNH